MTEENSLLGCDAILFQGSLMMVSRNVLPPSSWWRSEAVNQKNAGSQQNILLFIFAGYFVGLLSDPDDGNSIFL